MARPALIRIRFFLVFSAIVHQRGSLYSRIQRRIRGIGANQHDHDDRGSAFSDAPCALSSGVGDAYPRGSHRSTPKHGDAPATPFRTLSTFVLYPAAGAPSTNAVSGARPASEGSPFPLIVFAHGLDSNGPIYGPLIEQWAAAGFVVVAPTFPLSSISAPGGASVVDDIAQPGDLSFVLTQVLSLSQKKGNVLSGMIDPHRIAAVGHSLGAMTVLAWSEDTCCEDPRVDAAVVFDGVEAFFGKGAFFAGRTVPLLVLHGTADQTIPYKDGRQIYLDAKPPKYFVSLIGAPHVSFLQFSLTPQKPTVWEHVDVQSVIDFLEGELDDDGAALKSLAAVAEDPGVATLRQDP